MVVNSVQEGKCTEKDDILPDGFEINKGDGLSYMAYLIGKNAIH